VSGEPKSLTPPWAYYRRTGLSEMRPYVPGEDLTGISVSEADRATMAEDARRGMVTGGYIARNPKNHADQWYVAQTYFDENLEPLEEPVVARDEAAELRAANHAFVAFMEEHHRVLAALLPSNVLGPLACLWNQATALHDDNRRRLAAPGGQP